MALPEPGKKVRGSESGRPVMVLLDILALQFGADSRLDRNHPEI